MRKVADFESWEKVGLAAGWIQVSATEEPTPEDKKKRAIREAFIERMKGYGMTDEEVERALASGHLERLEQAMRRLT